MLNQNILKLNHKGIKINPNPPRFGNFHIYFKPLSNIIFIHFEAESEMLKCVFTLSSAISVVVKLGH